jgi:A118 family predicted phage portal protein
VHVPVAADLARTSADLLFSEPPSLCVRDDDAGSARLEWLADDLGLESMLPEAGELCAALSGIYWRVAFDLLASPERPVLSFVQPDNVWPEWSWGDLVAATFVRLLPRPAGSGEGEVWRHLERHSTGLVEHGLYVGRSDGLGRRVPLAEHSDLLGIAASLTSEDMITLGGVPMTAGYIPNMRPNRQDRGSPLGRADIDQQEDLLRGVDETWTSWLRDLRLGKARVVVPEEYLRMGAPGQGSTFDVDREVYSPLRMMAPSGSDPASAIKSIQFSIRTVEHQATLRALIQQIVTGAGYSMRTFGMGETDLAPATATQVNAEQGLSEVTREKKSRYWTIGLERACRALLALDASLGYPGSVRVDPSAVDVDFAEEADSDPQVVAQTANLLAQAQAASTDTLVRMVHPDWGEARVVGEVARIAEATGMPVADPIAIGAQAPLIEPMMSGSPLG